MQNLLEIGKIVRTHGVKGGVKVINYLDDDLSKFNHVFIGENKISARIKSISPLNSGAYLMMFDVIKDIDSAEKLKNKSVYIDREEYSEYKDKIYLSDLINAPVKNENGKELGVLVDFDDYGASVILTIRSGAVSYTIPYVDDIIKYDASQNAFIINEQTFKDIRV